MTVSDSLMASSEVKFFASVGVASASLSLLFAELGPAAVGDVARDSERVRLISEERRSPAPLAASTPREVSSCDASL
jgi:hypothetical protein